MRYVTFTLLLIASFLLFSACKSELAKTIATTTEIQLSGINKVQFLDSLAASKTIIKDDLEHFFDKITAVDASMQMKKAFPPTVSKDEVVTAYKEFLQHDVSNFTKEESEFIVKTMNQAFQLCQNVSDKFFPTDILLIKSHGQAYGEDTYYTRENCIIIPKQALAKRNADEFLKVMLHEISHIVTRTRPILKTQLYALIGFKKMANPLIINDSLSQRLLTNPDGVPQNWATTLIAAGNRSVFAIPLLYAKNNMWSAEQPAFFDNMDWNYFEVEPSTDATSLVVLTQGDKQQSTLDTKGINETFLQNYNTQYIIHPDEIIADNFSILMLSEKKSSILALYTEGGRTLIQKMRAVLAE